MSAVKTGRLRQGGLLTVLIFCALLLSARIFYLFLADANRFPINVVKIAASYQHITRKQLEAVLANYLTTSFFALPVRDLQRDLEALEWSDQVYVARIWPDTLKITVVERKPVAIWNNALMTTEGKLFNIGHETIDSNLPKLLSPPQQQLEVLQIYQKLSKLLSIYGLHAAVLQLSENQAWELSLTNGVLLRLGKQDIEQRLQRFCRAYPMIFADKIEQLVSVDLRYAHGMAVQWKGIK